MVQSDTWACNQRAYSRRVFAFVSLVVSTNLCHNSPILQINFQRWRKVLHVRFAFGLLPAAVILKCRILFRKRIQVLATWNKLVPSLHIKSISESSDPFFAFVFSEVVLVLLLEKIEFSLSDKEIVWQMNPISTPNVDMDGTTPTLPMKISLVNPKVQSSSLS